MKEPFVLNIFEVLFKATGRDLLLKINFKLEQFLNIILNP